MSYLIATNNFQRAMQQKKNADAANYGKVPAGAQPFQAGGAQGAVAQIEQEFAARLDGIQNSMAQLVGQLSPAARQRITPDMLAQAALSYQNFSFRPGLDNPSAPPIDAENGSIEGPIVLKKYNTTPASIGTSPTALSIDIALEDSDQTTTGGGRMITALGLSLIPFGAAANLPAGYDAASLRDTLVALGLVQVLTGTTIKAQYDAKDLIDTQFVQRVLEQPIRVQRGNYPATTFRFTTVAPPPPAALSTYSLTVVFASYWPQIR